MTTNMVAKVLTQKKSRKDSEEPLVKEDEYENKTCFCYRNFFLLQKIISVTETNFCERSFFVTETCFCDRIFLTQTCFSDWRFSI